MAAKSPGQTSRYAKFGDFVQYTQMNEVLKHWPHLYRRRRERALGINGKQIAYGQVIAIVSAIAVGFVLEHYTIDIAALAGAFVVLPAVFDLSSSLGAALGARVNHGLESEQSSRRVLLHAVGTAALHLILTGVLVSAAGAGVAAIFFDAVFAEIFWLGLSAMFISGVVGFPIIALLSVFFRRRNINPDDVVGPIETSLFYLLAVLTIGILSGGSSV